MPVPSLRTRHLNQKPANPEGDYVLYWMTAFRRTRYNFALERAVEWARKLDETAGDPGGAPVGLSLGQ